MNSFDLNITAIGVPAGMDASAGPAALREVETMQGGTVRNDLRLGRSLTSPRKLLRTLWQRIVDRRATVSPLNLTSQTRARVA